MDESELLKLAVKDLVVLATNANDIIIKGTFKGADSDEVAKVLTMCQNIFDTFVEKQHKEEKHEEK